MKVYIVISSESPEEIKGVFLNPSDAVGFAIRLASENEGYRVDYHPTYLFFATWFGDWIAVSEHNTLDN